MGRKWRRGEKELLRLMLEEGVPLLGITLSDRKYEGILRQARKLRLIGPLRNPSLTDGQKVKLRELRQQRFSVRQIAEWDLLGPPSRTKNAVYKMCSKLRIVDKNRSAAAKKRKVWCDGERGGFLDFLRRRSAALAPDQIAEIFGVKKGTVASLQRRLGVKPSLQETLALPFVREKFREVYQQKSQKMFADFEKRILERQKELEALAQRMREKRWFVPLGEKRCVSCGRFWPRHQKFFYYSTIRKNGLTSWFFFSRCKICVAKQRHQKNLQKRRQNCCR